MKTYKAAVSNDGRITIPKLVRATLNTHKLKCKIEGDSIILSPFQTREEFFEELKTIEKDMDENGGIPFEKVCKDFGL